MNKLIPIRSKTYSQRPIRRRSNITLSSLSARPSARLFQFPKIEQDEGYVYKTVPLSVSSPALVRKPLRRIVARTAIPYTLPSGWSGTYYDELLECGHTIHGYAGEEFKKRRGCQDCLDALAISISEKVAA